MVLFEIIKTESIIFFFFFLIVKIKKLLHYFFILSFFLNKILGKLQSERKFASKMSSKTVCDEIPLFHLTFLESWTLFCTDLHTKKKIESWDEASTLTRVS